MFEDNTQPLDQFDSTVTTETNNSASFFPTNSDFNDASQIGSIPSPDLETIELTPELNGDYQGDSSTDNVDLTGVANSTPLVGLAAENGKEDYSIDGLTGEVLIETDEFGIPQISAANVSDSVYGQGYVQAQDRLWQMEYSRRTADGTLAEILGEDAVEQDTNIRTLGIRQLAEIAYQNLSPEGKQIVDSYTAGVNAYLETNPDLPAEFKTLGYEPEAWQPIDVMAITQLQVFALGTTDGGEINRFELLQQGISPERIDELLPEYGSDDRTIISPENIEPESFSAPEPTAESITQATAIEQELQSGLAELADLFPDLEASNSWVVSGDRTTTGSPILANDPHLSLQTPSVWYQSAINSPEVNAVGVSLPGIPGIQIGRNQDIAWGETATLTDTEDYYILEETEDGLGYIYQGEEQPYEIREETIQVKDGESVTVEVKESIYGPVVSDSLGVEQPVALQAVGLEPVNGTLEAFLGINQAENWQEFTSALESASNPAYNFVYADTAGNIGYIAPGKYPIRQPGHTGEYPVPGTGEFDWQGFIPQSEVPQLYNPESGYIVTANNQPTAENYPYQINGSYAEPYRAERISELIESKDKLSVEDMQEIQFDRVTLLYRDFRPILEQIEPSSPEAQAWRDRLLKWDGDTLPNSQEASVFEAWYIELTKLPAEEVGREFFDSPRFLLEAIEQGDASCDREGSASGCYDEAALAFESALARFENDIPAWGEIHQTTFESLSEIQPESNLQVPLGGDNYTVNVSPVGTEDFDTSFGVSYRQIIDLDDLENSLYVNPPGQSGNVESDNFANQLPLWQRGEYLPMSAR